MKIHQLIKHLEAFRDQSLEVSISIDEEGNDFLAIDEIVYVGKNRVENAMGNKMEGVIIYPKPHTTLS